MANFYGHQATRVGLNLMAKLRATGRPLSYSSVQLGDGVLGGRLIYDMTGLISKRQELPIARTPVRSGDGRWNVTAVMTNEGVSVGYRFREWGIFARDPDTGLEVLVLYAHAGDTADYIPPWTGEEGGNTRIEQALTCACVVSSELQVTAEVDASQLYVLLEDFMDYQELVSQQLNGLTQNLSNHVADAAKHIYDATCTYAGGVFTLTGLPTALPDIFTVRFKAPADYAEGDTFAIGSTALQVKLSNMEPAPDELFKPGVVTTVDVDIVGEAVFFKTGGGLPRGWSEKCTAIAVDNIIKNQPIIFQRADLWDDTLVPKNLLSEYPTGDCNSVDISNDGMYVAVGLFNSSPYFIVYKKTLRGYMKRYFLRPQA